MAKGKTTKTDAMTASADKAPKTPAKKAAAPKKEVKAAAPPAAPVEEPAAAAAEAAPATEPEDTLALQSTEFLTKLQQLSALMTSLKTEYRALEKKWTRTLTAAQKASSKRKKRTGTRAPSGFVKPTRISDDLAAFLSKPSGTEMARTDVTRDINKYIREHDLQDKQNGRRIHPDGKLTALLKVGKDEELTYFNLQRYIKPHFKTAGESA